MAIVIEDGTGIATANSYITTAEFIAYMDLRYPSEATAEIVELEALLINATSEIDNNYIFVGSKKYDTSEQSLEWPRYNAFYNKRGTEIDSDIVPTELKNACCELVRVLESTNINEATITGIRSKRMGPVATVFSEGGKISKTFPAVSKWLAWIVTTPGLQVLRT